MLTINDASVGTQPHSQIQLCHHCNSHILADAIYHEHCREDSEWERKMKSLNPFWLSSSNTLSELD